MIVIQRPAAARFRAAARRCILGRPRGPAPPVVIEQTSDITTLFCNFGKVALSLEQSGGGTPIKFAVPGSLIDEIASARRGAAQIELNGDEGRCTWDQGESAFQRIAISEEDGPWPLPKPMKLVDSSLLAALHECGRSAGRDSAHIAFSRIQLQGRAGNVAGTDGRQMLLWNSFRFPFPDSVFVPAIPVFGGSEIAAEREIQLGKTDRHLIVAAGPWTIWLSIDNESKFPNVTSIIPRTTTSELNIDEADRQSAIAFVERAIEVDGEGPVVTLDFRKSPMLRATVAASGPPAKIALDRSQGSGEPVSLVVPRDPLARALGLGLTQISVPSENGPVIFRDDKRAFVVASLSPSNPIPASAPASPSTLRRSRSMVPISQGIQEMPPNSNGNGTHDSTDEALDFMAEAEALREAITEVARRASRLVNSLKQLQKHRRVLESAWSSLKNFRLGS